MDQGAANETDENCTMTYFSLIRVGLQRKPARTVLTMAAIAAAFVLFGILRSVNSGFDKALADQHLDRLITDARIPGGPPMPVSALANIKKIEGVTHAVQRATFLGFYQEPRNVVAMLATNPREWFLVRPEYKIAAEGLRDLEENRASMVVTPALQKYYGWKIGDKIPFTSKSLKKDGSNIWIFEFVGTFDISETPNVAYLALINFNYFDEDRVSDRGTAERFLVRISDPRKSVGVAAAIDRMFANSSHETRTRSEKEVAQSRMKQVGDISFFTNAIVGAVFFTLLFLTVNTMMQSFRERTAEFGVLKAIGYSDGLIVTIVFGEALTLSLVSALIGLAIAALGGAWKVDVLGRVKMSGDVIGSGLFAALALAFISAFVPAWRSLRLSVVDALAGR